MNELNKTEASTGPWGTSLGYIQLPVEGLIDLFTCPSGSTKHPQQHHYVILPLISYP